MNQTSYYHFLSDYGMAFVLLLLCAFFSVMTWSDQPVTGEAAAMQVAEEIQAEFGTKARVLIVARKSEDDAVFAAKLEQKLKEQGVEWVSLVRGQPTDARQALVEAVDKGQAVDAIACNQVTSTWGVFDSLAKQYPALSQTLQTPLLLLAHLPKSREPAEHRQSNCRHRYYCHWHDTGDYHRRH